MQFNLRGKDGTASPIEVNVRTICLGRAAGRDLSAMKSVVEKARAKGFAMYDVPNVCKKSRYLLTNEDTIEVQDRRTGGEVEYALISDRGRVLVTVGTDENDSTLIGLSSEALGKVYDPAKSKQMCPAVVARDVWSYDDVKDHWDQLRLRSRVMLDGDENSKRLYQDFPLASLRDPETNFKDFPWLRDDGTVLLSGSFDAVPDIPAKLFAATDKDGTFPDNFEIEIHDPVLNRTISHSFRIQHLVWPDSDKSP